MAIDRKELERNKNEDVMLRLVGKLNLMKDEAHLGGGKKKLEKRASKGLLSARQRVDLLLDKDRHFIELGVLAAHDMYQEEGGCPSGGCVGVIGYVAGQPCIVLANDATVKAGAWFPMTAKKNLRLQEIAIENRLPVIYLVDSAGVYLPLQDQVFPDKEHFGRIFRNNAKLSSMGVYQIAAIMGNCVAGGAYLPIMSDESIIVDGIGTIFLAGPHLVKAAIGETVDKETLGGATVQTAVSGNCDYKVESEEECIELIRDLVSKKKFEDNIGLNRAEPVDPEKEIEDILGEIPESRATPYDSYRLLKHLVDEGSFSEFKKDYGQTIITGTARIEGWSVGVVMNNRNLVKNSKKELQIGGVIYSDSADKAARFIMNCNQKKIPLIFLHDVTGFIVGSRAEHGGIIKDGAKMVNAMANSTVPKISIIVGNSNGAGNYAMCGKAYDPRFIFAWPNAKIAVMGGEQASKVLTQIRVAQAKNAGVELDEEKQKELKQEILDRYERQTSPIYAAARLWVDDIIDPRETRKVISSCLDFCNYSPIEPFNVGVLQT